jgi:hypothetical protein
MARRLRWVLAATAAAAVVGAGAGAEGAPPAQSPAQEQPNSSSIAAALSAVCRAAAASRAAQGSGSSRLPARLPASRPSLSWTFPLLDDAPPLDPHSRLRFASVVAAPGAGVGVVGLPAGGAVGVDLTSGREVWRSPRRGSVLFVPVVDVPGAGVVVGHERGLATDYWPRHTNVTAVDPATGATVWRVPPSVGGHLLAGGAKQWSFAGVACDGRTVLASAVVDVKPARLVVAALDGADGALVWVRQAVYPHTMGVNEAVDPVSAGVACGSAAPGGRGLVFARLSDAVVAMNGNTGELLWVRGSDWAIGSAADVPSSGAGMLVTFGRNDRSLGLSAPLLIRNTMTGAIIARATAAPTPSEPDASSADQPLLIESALSCGSDGPLMASMWWTMEAVGVTLEGDLGAAPRSGWNRTILQHSAIPVLWGVWHDDEPVALVASRDRDDVVAVTADGGEAWAVLTGVNRGSDGSDGRGNRRGDIDLVSAGNGVVLVVGQAAIEAWAVPAGGLGPNAGGGGGGGGDSRWSPALVVVAVVLAAVGAAAAGDGAWRFIQPAWRTYRPHVDEGPVTANEDAGVQASAVPGGDGKVRGDAG